MNDLLEYIHSFAKRLETLEDIFNKIDKILAESNVKHRTNSDKFNEVKDELSKSVNVQIKHEINILRKQQSDFESRIDEIIKKVKSESSRLRGRVGSLVEEKANLTKRIIVIENNNKKLQDELLYLHNDLTENQPSLKNHNESVNKEGKDFDTDLAEENKKQEKMKKRQPGKPNTDLNEDKQKATFHDFFYLVIQIDGIWT